MVAKKPNIVVIGGGTGMPVLLKGLKDLPINLTTIVTVADDGGSSGKLRSIKDAPAPGDIRNVLSALAENDSTLAKLFQYRFDGDNELSGHAIGNMVLVAISEITGDFHLGIEELSKLLQVKGTVLPIVNESVSLYAQMTDGTIVSGESNIPLVNKKIKRVFLDKVDLEPAKNVLNAIEDADLIVISPGSLYTSILPNLIVPEVLIALKSTKAKKVYVCNLMTQPGETCDYSAGDHVQAIYDHIGDTILDGIIVHNQPINKYAKERYAETKSKPVVYDLARLKALNLKIIERDIIDPNKKQLRHDTKKIANILYELAIKKEKG